jgi:hypothetical protein
MLASTFLRPGSRQFRLTVVLCRSKLHAVRVFPAETAALTDNLLKVDSEPESNKRQTEITLEVESLEEQHFLLRTLLAKYVCLSILQLRTPTL